MVIPEKLVSRSVATGHVVDNPDVRHHGTYPPGQSLTAVQVPEPESYSAVRTGQTHAPKAAAVGQVSKTAHVVNVLAAEFRIG